MGTKFPLPMSIINLIENIAMGAMAVYMLIRMGSITMAQAPVTMNNSQEITTEAKCH